MARVELILLTQENMPWEIQENMSLNTQEGMPPDAQESVQAETQGNAQADAQESVQTETQGNAQADAQGSVQQEIQEKGGIQITRLLGNYAVAVLEEDAVAEFLGTPGILYAELPSRIYEQVEDGKGASCIYSRPSGVQEADTLGGRGVLLAVIDSGERVIIMSS